MVLSTLGDISTAVGSLGFPIVMCFMLLYYIAKDTKANREQIEKLTIALNNNTNVIGKLLERLDSDNEWNNLFLW